MILTPIPRYYRGFRGSTAAPIPMQLSSLVAFYDIRPGNGAGLFLQPRSPHGSEELWRKIQSLWVTVFAVQQMFIHGNSGYQTKRNTAQLT